MTEKLPLWNQIKDTANYFTLPLRFSHAVRDQKKFDEATAMKIVIGNFLERQGLSGNAFNEFCGYFTHRSLRLTAPYAYAVRQLDQNAEEQQQASSSQKLTSIFQSVSTAYGEIDGIFLYIHEGYDKRYDTQSHLYSNIGQDIEHLDTAAIKHALKLLRRAAFETKISIFDILGAPQNKDNYLHRSIIEGSEEEKYAIWERLSAHPAEASMARNWAEYTALKRAIVLADTALQDAKRMK